MLVTGYVCEDCGEAVWPATSRSELQWLRGRRHIVREVERHLSGGLDGWMDEAMRFLDEHDDHPVVIVERPRA